MLGETPHMRRVGRRLLIVAVGRRKEADLNASAPDRRPSSRWRFQRACAMFSSAGQSAPRSISEREMFATQCDVAKDGRYVINVNTGQVGKTPIMVMLDSGA